MLVEVIIWCAAVGAIVCQDLRWLRVAQREDYLPGRIPALIKVWLQARPINLALLGLAIISVLVGLFVSWVGLIGLAILVIWPWWLPLKARSKRLGWTGRMKRLTLVVCLSQIVLLVASWHAVWAALVALLTPLVIMAACWVMEKVEARLAKKWVVEATAKLAKVRPTIVAITGSYGKTSTKLYTHQLLSRTLSTVASPASFNNLMGLSRTVNDRLTHGSEVLIAEMGTYGPGEIRQLCEIFQPTIACITTIGEAHLERMGSRATIVAAKAEITEQAPEVVLNVDVPELAELAQQLDASRRVMRVSTNPDSRADVTVISAAGQWQVLTPYQKIATIPAPEAGHPINLAVAVAVGVLLDVPLQVMAEQMQDLPRADHRAELHRTDHGVIIVDDTYNSNPDGAHGALQAAFDVAQAAATVITVTPGMVELGAAQAERNAAFAHEATSGENTRLFIVGYTNKKALQHGSNGQPGQVRWFRHRAEAAQAAMVEAKPGDVVVFENDLPDHYA